MVEKLKKNVYVEEFTTSVKSKFRTYVFAFSFKTLITLTYVSGDKRRGTGEKMEKN
jgi:hypothetical protein